LHKPPLSRFVKTCRSRCFSVYCKEMHETPDDVLTAFYGWRKKVSTWNDQRARTLAKMVAASSICLSVICRWVTAR
jgi:hypothetical protein